MLHQPRTLLSVLLRCCAPCAVLLGLTAAAGAQCTETWRPGGLTLGFDAPVHCTAVWQSPGGQPLLVVGGAFTIAGNVAASRVAAWDGQSWHPLGGGLDGIVRALCVHDGSLYAGGDFVTAGGLPAAHLARYEAGSWHAVAPGLNGPVRALASFGGDLYVGGSFDAAGGPRFLTRWNGAQWSTPGTGVVGTVFTMLPRAGEIIVGGNITSAGGQFASRVARWDGASWHPIPGLSVVTTRALAELNGQIIAGGTSIAGMESLQRWTGFNWEVLTCLWGSTSWDLTIYDLTVHQGQLILGFDGPEGIARWTGSSCVSMTQGIGGSSPWVATVQSLGNELFAGGNYSGVGNVGANYSAFWDGAAWRPAVNQPMVSLGIDDRAATAVNWQGGFAIGGRFAASVPGGGPSRAALLFDGEQWQAMPGITEGQIHQMLVFGSDPPSGNPGSLMAAGSFRLNNASQWHGIARWTGVQWESWPPGFPLPTATVLAEHQGNLIVAGSAAYAWTGEVWQPISGSLYNPQRLLSNGSDLYLCGGFLNDGYVHVWNGAQWTQVGQWPGRRVTALTIHNGQLIAGGYFENVPAALGLAKWTGTAWEWLAAPDPPLPVRGDVWELVSHGGDLYIGGTAYIGPGAAPMVYRWNGTHWHNLGGPENGWSAWALLLNPGRITVAGNFRSTAGLHSPLVTHGDTPRFACPANCDCSVVPPILNVEDFTCFINQFASAQALPHEQQITHYANCDRSTTPPVLNVEDFTCFINAFAAGCR
jgi:trimeric autotransporter adhesin